MKLPASTLRQQLAALREALLASHELLRWQRVRPDITRQIRRNERVLHAVKGR